MAVSKDKIVQELIPLRNNQNFSSAIYNITGVRLTDKSAKAVLIQLVFSTFDETKDKYTVKRDVVLSSFALINEYSAISEVIERRKQYIYDTGYNGKAVPDKAFLSWDHESEKYKKELSRRLSSLLKYETRLYGIVADYYLANYISNEDINQLINCATRLWVSPETSEILLPLIFCFGVFSTNTVLPYADSTEKIISNNFSISEDVTNSLVKNDKKSCNHNEAAKNDIPKKNTELKNQAELITPDRKCQIKTKLTMVVIAIFLVIAAIAVFFLGENLYKNKISFNKVQGNDETTSELTKVDVDYHSSDIKSSPETLEFIATSSEENYSQYNDWGDSNGGRQIYTTEDINKGLLGDNIVFNSISDGKVGDEKKFVGAKKSDSMEDVWINDLIEVQDGEVYTICLYVHNDNPNGLDAIAEDTRITFSLPTTVSTSHTIVGYIDSSNVNVSRCWDTVTFNSDELFYLEYIDGSAKYFNNRMGNIGLGDDAIFEGGHPLGYDRFDGKIPGGYEYAGVVTIEVIAHQTTAVAKIKVSARLSGTKEWKDNIVNLILETK